MVIDAGANIGMFTLQAARIVGSSGLIVSVEPPVIESSYAWVKNLTYNGH